MSITIQPSDLDTVLLVDVDREQHHRGWFLSFAVGLEALFQREMVIERSKSVAINWLVGFTLFHSFLLSDLLLLPNDFGRSLFYHFGVFTPIWTLLCFLVIRIDKRFYGFVMAFSSFMTLSTELAILVESSGPNRLFYMSGLAAAPMCLYVLLRPGLVWALLSMLAQSVAYSAVLVCTDVVGGDGRLVVGLFFLSGATITIMAAYALEGAGRRSFLLSLRVRLLNRELERMAMTDPLMGLGNRRLLNERTTLFWSEPVGSTRIASMILIDVDHFKSFNDHYGHAAGDLCLKTIAACVSGLTEGGPNTAVRFGGEEIAVFLPDTEFAPARQVAETIHRAIVDAAIPHPAVSKDAVVTASLGVAAVSVADHTADELAIRADLALYAAKHHGRNQVWPPATGVECSTSPPCAAMVPGPDQPSIPLVWAS